jgi:hypothetical protein
MLPRMTMEQQRRKRERDALYRASLRDVLRERARRYYADNKEATLARKRESYVANRAVLLERHRRYYRAGRGAEIRARRAADPAAFRARENAYRESRRDALREYSRGYRSSNRGRINAVRRATQARRYAEDVVYRMAHVLRSRVMSAVRLQGARKSASTTALLGATASEVYAYLVAILPEGMTERDLRSSRVHIDHVRPIARFDLTQPEQQRACFHYTNLRPMWAEDNLAKGSAVTVIKVTARPGRARYVW